MEKNNNNISLNSKQQQQQQQDIDGEEFHQEFKCCVCLDLLYKPVVLACGHISCFWCVQGAMNDWHESHCPICRHPYNHFPSICQLLHFLLLKLYPAAYKRRETQVGEKEKETGYFSPQFDLHICGSCPSEELEMLGNSPHSPTLPQTNSESLCSAEGESSSCMNSSETILQGGDSMPIKPVISSKSSKATTNATIEEYSSLGNDLEHRAHRQVCAADLLCVACKKLLLQPVVLNCGHVYCESCIIVPENAIPRCQVCQRLHPYGFPRVCLILEHFLVELFPEIYAERKEALLKQTDCSTRARQHVPQSSSNSTSAYSSWWFGNGPKVHVAVGCDSCGMCPIIGERYKCKDCVEKIGFDLCETCYNTPANIPGRFNQQHSPEHKFEIVPPASISSIMFRLNAEMSDDDGSDAPEEPDDVSHAPILAGDVPQEPENGSNDLEVSPAFILTVHASLDSEDDSDDPVSSDPCA